MKIPNEQIGANVAILRKGKSQKDVAVAMKERGHSWSQATVSSVETGERPLRLSESVDLAAVLAVPLQDLFEESSTNVFNTLYGRLEAAKRSLQSELKKYRLEVLRVSWKLTAPEFLPQEELWLQMALCESPARIFANQHEDDMESAMELVLGADFTDVIEAQEGIARHKRRVGLTAKAWDHDAVIINENPVQNV